MARNSTAGHLGAKAKAASPLSSGERRGIFWLENGYNYGTPDLTPTQFRSAFQFSFEIQQQALMVFAVRGCSVPHRGGADTWFEFANGDKIWGDVTLVNVVSGNMQPKSGSHRVDGLCVACRARQERGEVRRLGRRRTQEGYSRLGWRWAAV